MFMEDVTDDVMLFRLVELVENDCKVRAGGVMFDSILSQMVFKCSVQICNYNQ